MKRGGERKRRNTYVPHREEEFYVPPGKVLHVTAVRKGKRIRDIQSAFPLDAFLLSPFSRSFLPFSSLCESPTFLLLLSNSFVRHVGIHSGGSTFASSGPRPRSICMSDVPVI